MSTEYSIPRKHTLKILCKFKYFPRRYKRKREWVFFFWTQWTEVMLLREVLCLCFSWIFLSDSLVILVFFQLLHFITVFQNPSSIGVRGDPDPFRWEWTGRRGEREVRKRKENQEIGNCSQMCTTDRRRWTSSLATTSPAASVSNYLNVIFYTVGCPKNSPLQCFVFVSLLLFT